MKGYRRTTTVYGWRLEQRLVDEEREELEHIIFKYTHELGEPIIHYMEGNEEKGISDGYLVGALINQVVDDDDTFVYSIVEADTAARSVSEIYKLFELHIGNIPVKFITETDYI